MHRIELDAYGPDALRRSIRDLVALTSLPAIWTGREPYDIAAGFSDVMLSLLRLDLVYIYLTHFSQDAPLELVRTTQGMVSGEAAHDIGKSFAPFLTPDNTDQVFSVANPFWDGSLHIVVLAIGHNGVKGYTVVGSRSSNALTELDRLLLKVAANQTMIALEQAKLLADLSEANQVKDALISKEQGLRTEAQQTTKQIALLQKLTSALSQSLTVEEIAHTALESSARLFNSEGGAVYLLSEDRQSVYPLEHLNKEALETSFLSLALATPFSDTLKGKEAICIETLEDFLQKYPHIDTGIYLGTSQAIVVVPFLSKDEVLGCLELHFSTARRITSEELNLLSAVAHQCGQALERARLSKQARLAATVEERQRLARDLHDAVSQTLFSATMIAEALPRVWERTPRKVFGLLNQIVLLNRSAMAEMRNLLLELRPEAINRTDLGALLNQLIEVARGRKWVEAQLMAPKEPLFLPSEVHAAFYRVAQEAINNILKHSSASEFKVHLTKAEAHTLLSIEDNGHGFDMDHSSAGLGLNNMRERAALIDADISISSHPGTGTTVTLDWEPDPVHSSLH